MKKLLLIILSFLTTSAIFSQDLINFTTDCTTDFFTITFDGYIQQWSLINGAVQGGDTIVSGGGLSLSYSGDNDEPKFYSNNYSPLSITYHDSDSGWVDIPTQYSINNNGGHHKDLYYTVEGAVIQIIKYWDGTNLVTVDSLQGEFFVGIADIAVDTLGQAWITIGAGFGSTDSLKVYNKNGKVDAYSFQTSLIGYGSFFLNNMLYIGTNQDSIYPVVINGSSAELGTAIAFPSSNFTDMASCQESKSSVSIEKYSDINLKLFPNPTSGYVAISLDINEFDISLYSAEGKLLNVKFDGEILDLTDQPSGVYFIKILTEGGIYTQKVVKL